MRTTCAAGCYILYTSAYRRSLYRLSVKSGRVRGNGQVVVVWHGIGGVYRRIT